MEYLWFTIIFFSILIPLVLAIIIPIFKEHFKTTEDAINYNIDMRKFVYKINLSGQQVIDLLSTKSNADELSCTFDFDKETIRFSEYGSHRDYHFNIQEYNSFSVLRLEQVGLVGMQSYVPYKLNSFLIKKLNAQIVPFAEYEF